jgi:hypothetical protein
MPGNWGNLDCPDCGCTHATPAGVTAECEELVAELVCPECGKGCELRVELWRYYGVAEELPSREDDR